MARIYKVTFSVKPDETEQQQCNVLATNVEDAILNFRTSVENTYKHFLQDHYPNFSVNQIVIEEVHDTGIVIGIAKECNLPSISVQRIVRMSGKY